MTDKDKIGLDNIGELINSNIQILKTSLDFISNSEKELNTIDINHKFFNKKYCSKVDITTCPEVKINHLKNIKTPVLYWFQLQSSINNKAIRESYISYREGIKTDFLNPNYRNTSSYKKIFWDESRVLYIGKVQDHFWGRLVTHLGYNKSVKTAGLQLYHWYDLERFGGLKLNFIVFDKSMKYQVEILEKELTINFKPLIGLY